MGAQRPQRALPRPPQRVPHGGDGKARGGHAVVGAGGDGRRLSQRQAGLRCGGQDPLRGRGLDWPRGPLAQGEAGSGSGACASTRSRAVPSARWLLKRRSSPMASVAGARSPRPDAAIGQSASSRAARPLAWRPSNKSTPHSAISRAPSPEPTSSSDPITPNATSPVSFGATIGATSFKPHPQYRANATHALSYPHRRMAFRDQQV